MPHSGERPHEALPDGAIIGEIEDLGVGAEGSATFDLEAGTYTIFCNLQVGKAHFQQGMVTQIEVGA